MNGADGLYTLKGYSLHEDSRLTHAMEDYLEMISRLSPDGRHVRAHDLSRLLHVKASSVTKMVQQLAQAGYVQAERYGGIVLTEQGKSAGQYLLYRHDVLQRFLCTVNHTADELEQVEKIEHFLDRRTIRNMELLLRRLPADDA